MLTAHFRFIHRVLRRLGVQEADVDDAAQQVFIIANNRLDRVEVGKERAFLFATATRVAANARRSQRHRPGLLGDATERLAGQDDPSSPEELLQKMQVRRLLDVALDGLPMELRTVFVLYELEELSCPNIAELTGLALGTVASRLRRARACFEQTAERLRDDLSKDGGAS